jgi:serine/threonine protein kinase
MKEEVDKYSNFKLVYTRDGTETKLNDFQVVNMIGKGSISNVYLVKRKSDERPFAMKCI